jgi:hypothetical protein
VQDLTGPSLMYLEFLKGQRSEAGGGALDAESSDNQALDKQIGAVASQQVLMNQELRSVQAAENLAQSGFKPMMIMVHKLLREEFNGSLTVRMADQYIQTQPSTWQPRTRLTEPTGLSPTMRNREAANLASTLQTQMGLLQSGSTLVTPDNIHNSLMEWGQTVNLPISEFYTDPNSEQGQQAAQQQTEQAQQQQQMAAQIEQIPAQIAQLKEEASTARNTQDNETAILIQQMKDAVDEAKLTLDGINKAQDREAQALTNGADNGGTT